MCLYRLILQYTGLEGTAEKKVKCIFCFFYYIEKAKQTNVTEANNFGKLANLTINQY